MERKVQDKQSQEAVFVGQKNEQKGKQEKVVFISDQVKSEKVELIQSRHFQEAENGQIELEECQQTCTVLVGRRRWRTFGCRWRWGLERFKYRLG